jgi:hypothetical protein
MTPLARILAFVTLLLGLFVSLAGFASANGGDGGGGGGEPLAGTRTLQGENLIAPFAGLTVTSDCNEAPESSEINYRAEGAATGPFPGTFVAEGRITIGPQTTPARPPGVGSEGTFSGPVLTLTESFTIVSGGTTIEGSKQLAQPIAGERERATCQNLTLFGGIEGSGRIVEVEAATTYEATIEETAGTFADSGRATPVLTLVEISGSCPGGLSCESRSGNFDQLFTLSDQAAECDEDSDNQGDEDCRDEDEG